MSKQCVISVVSVLLLMSPKTRMSRKNRYCRIFVFVLISCAFIFSFALYTCLSTQKTSTCFGVTEVDTAPVSDYDAFLQGKILKHQFDESDIVKQRRLDFEGNDVLVYLHIQKTGGATFGRHLVHNLDVDFPCECVPDVKKCKCFTKNNRVWLFSRHATGWMCGLHADWTELNDCVDEWFKQYDVKSRKFRRYHYITFLRNPVKRFLSEWQHVQRGATWKAARLHCNGRGATLDEVPFCFHGVNWYGVAFDEFVSCKHNLAFNRMTRMMANLSHVNCYNRTAMNEAQVGEILLKSAKENLLDFIFFGIVEEQQKTQFLFEKTVGLRFVDNFKQKEQTHVSRLDVTDKMTQEAIAKNSLDIELYQYAKDLFLQRVASMERKLGYTVEEYFHHIRDEEEKDIDEVQEVGNHEYDDEDEEGDEDGEKVKFYPSKTYVPEGGLDNAANTSLRWKNLR